MNRDIPVYYRVYKYHEELFGNTTPVYIKELLLKLGTEVRTLDKYVAKVDKKYFTYIRLCDFLGRESRPKKLFTPDMKAHYPWDNLVQSIKENGIIAPCIAERVFDKGILKYYVVEGKHRLTAALFVEPFNPDMLVPTIIVDRDMEYMEYKRRESEGLGMNITDMEDARLHEQQKKEKDMV